MDNEKGGEAYPISVEGRVPTSPKRRAQLVGQVWSADLAETLIDVYSHLFAGGYSLEDVSRLVVEPSDDGSGD